MSGITARNLIGEIRDVVAARLLLDERLCFPRLAVATEIPPLRGLQPLSGARARSMASEPPAPAAEDTAAPFLAASPGGGQAFVFRGVPTGGADTHQKCLWSIEALTMAP